MSRFGHTSRYIELSQKCRWQRRFRGIGRPAHTDTRGRLPCQIALSLARTSPKTLRVSASAPRSTRRAAATTSPAHPRQALAALPPSSVATLLQITPAEHASAVEGSESLEFAGLSEATASATHKATHIPAPCRLTDLTKAGGATANASSPAAAARLHRRGRHMPGENAICRRGRGCRRGPEIRRVAVAGVSLSRFFIFSTPSHAHASATGAMS